MVCSTHKKGINIRYNYRFHYAENCNKTIYLRISYIVVFFFFALLFFHLAFSLSVFFFVHADSNPNSSMYFSVYVYCIQYNMSIRAHPSLYILFFFSFSSFISIHLQTDDYKLSYVFIMNKILTHYRKCKHEIDFNFFGFFSFNGLVAFTKMKKKENFCRLWHGMRALAKMK